jgi:hypothetical protein
VLSDGSHEPFTTPRELATLHHLPNATHEKMAIGQGLKIPPNLSEFGEQFFKNRHSLYKIWYYWDKSRYTLIEFLNTATGSLIALDFRMRQVSRWIDKRLAVTCVNGRDRRQSTAQIGPDTRDRSSFLCKDPLCSHRWMPPGGWLNGDIVLRWNKKSSLVCPRDRYYFNRSIVFFFGPVLIMKM